MSRNHTVKGSVDYTVVGSPTIVDGVLSNTTGADYVATSSSLDLTSPFELVTRVNTSEEKSSIIHCVDPQFMDVFAWPGQGVIMELPANTTTTAIPWNINTWYTLKITGDGTNITIAAKADNESAFVSRTATIPASYSSSSTSVMFGRGYITSSEATGNCQIDLNKTYIKVNGQAWFGKCPVEVKHINYGTNVGYTVVGNPTIVNGVASGFSSSNYLETTIALPGPFYSVESFCKFTTGQTIGQSTIYGTGINWSRYGFFLDSDAHLCAGVMIEGSSRKTVIGTTVLQPSTTYYAKMSADIVSHTITLSVSTDNRTWNTDVLDFEGGTGFYTSASKIKIGNAQHGAFAGSIDLNETYIKVNGKLWFFRPCTNYQVHNGKLVFADSGLYLSGPNTYETLSDPTAMVDGIYTNTGKINPVQLSNSFDITTDDFFFRAVFSIADASEVRYLYYNPFGVRIDGYDVQIRLNRNGSNINTSMFTAELNQWYILEIEKSGAVFTARYSVDDGTTYTSCLNLDTTGETLADISTVLPRFGRSTGSNNFYGSIDFKRTYIKVNGSLWFYGKNYASQNIAPVPAGYHTKGQVGCVAVGSPTIVDGAVSGLVNRVNYIQIPQLPNDINSFEFVIKASPKIASRCLLFYSATGPSAYYKFNALISASSSFKTMWTYKSSTSSTDKKENSVYADGGVPYTELQPVWTKLGMAAVGNGIYNYSISYSLDGQNYVLVASKEASYKMSGADIGALRLVSNPNYSADDTANMIPQQLDLNGTYIKVNNEMWFDGKGQYPFTGYVDMRTQKFTSAPSGTTIGKDE